MLVGWPIVWCGADAVVRCEMVVGAAVQGAWFGRRTTQSVEEKMCKRERFRLSGEYLLKSCEGLSES